MKVTIKKEKIIRETEEVEVELPSKTRFYFITGERRAYKVVPIYVDFPEKDTLYEYDIVRVDNNWEHNIEQFTIRVSSIPNILENMPKRCYSIVNRIVNHTDEGTRTKEQFEKDLNRAIEATKKGL